MQNSYLNFILILSIGFIAQAKDPVYFLPEKNNLQILPQKFEYNLVNNSTIKIGDIVIDSNNLSLNLNSDKLNRTLTVSWPAGLFKEGELIIFNNYGKAIKNFIITKKDIELIVQTDEKSDSLLRKDKAIFKTPPIEDSLFDQIKYLPFFKFCLQRNEENTRVNLCSVELYLSSKDGNTTVKSRSEGRNKAQILINNVEVGEQGIIFLNDLDESISFQAQSESGAKLEIETRLKPVDFKDVTITDDGNNLILVGYGSSPVSTKNVKRLSNDLWQIQLPLEYPVFYIQGEGGIPFRQEFFVRGALPTESMRTYTANVSRRTYASSEKLALEIPKGASLISKDTNSKVNFNKNTQKFDWTVSALEKGKDSARIVYIKKDKDEFALYEKFYRAPAFDARLGVMQAISEKVSFLNLGINYWLNNKKSGLGFKLEQSVTKTDLITKWSNTHLSYYHRLTPGMNFTDSTYYIAGNIRNTAIADLSFSLLGVGVGNQSLVSSGFKKKFADWFDWSFNYYMGAKSKESEIKSLMAIELRSLIKLSNNYFFEYGLNFQNLSVKNMGDVKTSQLDLKAGVVYLF